MSRRAAVASELTRAAPALLTRRSIGARGNSRFAISFTPLRATLPTAPQTGLTYRAALRKARLMRVDDPLPFKVFCFRSIVGGLGWVNLGGGDLFL